MQSDPIGLGGGLNTYSYVGGNSVNFADARGLVPNPAEAACALGPNPVCAAGVVADVLTNLVGLGVGIAMLSGNDNVIPFPGTADDIGSCPIENPDGPDDCELRNNALIIEEIRINQDVSSSPPQGGDMIAHAARLRLRKEAWNRAADAYNRDCVPRGFPVIGRRL